MSDHPPQPPGFPPQQPGFPPQQPGFPPQQPGFPPQQPGYPPQQPGWNQMGYGYGAGGPPVAQIGGLATALSVLVGLTSLVALAGALAFFSRASLIDDPSASFVEIVDADDRVAGSVGFFFLAYVVTGIVWVIWQFRFAKNLTALGRPLEGGAGRAIWGWFIPIANFFIAPNQLLRAAKETDRARGGAGRAPSTLVPWWIAFAVGLLFVGISGQMRPADDAGFSSIDEFQSADYVGGLGLGLVAVAGVLAIVTIRACTARQLGTAAPAGAPPVAPPTTF